MYRFVSETGEILSDDTKWDCDWFWRLCELIRDWTKTVYCLLPTAYCMLYAVCCMLYTVCCMLLAACLAQRNTIQPYTALHSLTQPYTALHCTALHGTAWHCTALHCITHRCWYRSKNKIHFLFDPELSISDICIFDSIGWMFFGTNLSISRPLNLSIFQYFNISIF
jgi:hypothetical protein